MEKITPHVPVFGINKSPVDYRDIPMATVVAAPTTLPSSGFVDISKLPVWYQRQIGACTGHAGGKLKQKLDSVDLNSVPQLSARFLYAIAKCKDGQQAQGTSPRNIAQALKDYGCATEATVPNDTTLDHETYVFNRKIENIPVAAFTEAVRYKISGYSFPNVKNLSELKTAVLNCNGAMLLVQVGQEWWTSKVGVTSWSAADVLPLRAPKSIVSGHEVYLYGYTDVVENGITRTKIYIFNSWSDQWGDKGMGWFYYDEYAAFVIEAITVTDIPDSIASQLKLLPAKADFKHSFATAINFGQTGAEVTALQTALMIDGCFPSSEYAQLLICNGLGTYGPHTALAVTAYQTKYKLATPAVIAGIAGKSVGPATRAHLNSWTNK